MPEQNLASEVHKLLHDMRGPLSTIKITGANIRIRCKPDLDDEKAAYLQGKLERIGQQVERVAALLEQLSGLFEAAGCPADEPAREADLERDHGYFSDPVTANPKRPGHA